MGCTMVLRVSLLPAVCVLGMAATRHVSHPTVKITVFYESLCPDSKRFVTEQLYPAWGKFGQSLRVSLKPFGKAKVWQTESGWNFTCQHGPQECRGNKLQACVLDQVPDPEEYLPAINCLMEPEARPDCTQYLVSTSTARLSSVWAGRRAACCSTPWPRTPSVSIRLSHSSLGFFLMITVTTPAALPGDGAVLRPVIRVHQ